MHVHELMTHAPAVCTTTDHLTRAAQIMWERDCGSVPVLDEAGKLTGIVTDRDICMAAYTQGRALHEIPVSSVMSKVVYAVGPDATAADALDTMNRKAVRRLPVTDASGRLLGILSLADFTRVARESAARRAPTRDAVIDALAAVSTPRPIEHVAPISKGQAQASPEAREGGSGKGIAPAAALPSRSPGGSDKAPLDRGTSAKSSTSKSAKRK